MKILIKAFYLCLFFLCLPSLILAQSWQSVEKGLEYKKLPVFWFIKSYDTIDSKYSKKSFNFPFPGLTVIGPVFLDFK